MTISNEQFAARIKDAKDTYTVLCEIDYTIEQTEAPHPAFLRCATLAYVDTENEVIYPDWIHAVPSWSRDLIGENLNNFGSTIGSLILNNADGALDELADLFVDGADCRFYAGDVGWPRSDFRLIFTATVSKVSIPSKDRLVFELRDTGALLNKRIGGEYRIGGEGPNIDRFRPVNLGYLPQVEAILADVDTQTFIYNDTGDGLWLGDTEHIVRDNGYPVGFIDNGDGSFTLDDTPIGTVTTNVMATPAGGEENRLTSDIIDALVRDRAGLGALGKYDGAQDTFEVGGLEDWPLGLNITESRNIVEVLREVCDSGLCFWAISRLNSFFYGRLRPSYMEVLGVEPVATIEEHHVETFSREPFDPRWYKLQVQVNRNSHIPSTTVSTDSGGDPRILTPEELLVVTRAGITVLQEDSATSSYEAAPERYHETLSVSPVLETLLTDPNEEEARLVALGWMEPARANQLPWLHEVTIRVPLQFYELELGNVVTLEYPRYGYSAGADFQIIGIDIQLLTRKVVLRLLRRHIQAPYAGRETRAPDEPPVSEDLTVGVGGDGPPVGPPLPPGLPEDGIGTGPGPLFPGAGAPALCAAVWPTAELGDTDSGNGCHGLPSGKSSDNVISIVITGSGGTTSLDTDEFTLTTQSYPVPNLLKCEFDFHPQTVIPNFAATFPNADKRTIVTVTYDDASTSTFTIRGTVAYVQDGYIVAEAIADQWGSSGQPHPSPIATRWKWYNTGDLPVGALVWLGSDFEEFFEYDSNLDAFGPKLAIPANSYEFIVDPDDLVDGLRAISDTPDFNPIDSRGKTLTFQTTPSIGETYASGDRLMSWFVRWFDQIVCVYGYQDGVVANGTDCYVGMTSGDVPATIGSDTMPPVNDDPFGTANHGDYYRRSPRKFNYS